jgi:hypothetical protein
MCEPVCNKANAIFDAMRKHCKYYDYYNTDGVHCKYYGVTIGRECVIDICPLCKPYIDLWKNS